MVNINQIMAGLFENLISLLTKRISKFSKIVRILAWIFRCQKKSKTFLKISQVLQMKKFHMLKRSFFIAYNLNVFPMKKGEKSLPNFQIHKDDNGIWRLKTRFVNEDEACNFILLID